MTFRRGAVSIAAVAAALVAAYGAVIGFRSGNIVTPSAARSRLDAAPPLPKVSITLLGRAAAISGVNVPTASITGDQPESFQIGHPSLISLTVPGRKEFSLPVKTAFVNTMMDVNAKTGVVMDVDLLPLQESVPFGDAVAELRRLLLATEITPDVRMQKYLDNLPNDSSYFIYRTGVELNAAVKFMVALRPDGNGGWFLVLTFGAIGDASRAVWDTPSSAKSNPAVKRRASSRTEDRAKTDDQGAFAKTSPNRSAQSTRTQYVRRYSTVDAEELNAKRFQSPILL